MYLQLPFSLIKKEFRIINADAEIAEEAQE